jgi:sortase A
VNVSQQVGRKNRFLLSGLMWGFYFFLALGLIAAGYAGYVVAEAESYQAIELRKFTVKPPLAPRHVPAIGEVIGEIEIPRLGIQAIIAQGDTAEVLRHALGHIPETSLPGDTGNIGLAGHRDRLFRKLRVVQPGDIVILKTPSETFRFQVETTLVVPSTDVEVLRSSNRRELTLITCFPFDFVGSAPDRFVVHARELTTNGN